MSLSARIDGWLAPKPEPRRVAFLSEQPFAHRGLHGGSVLENSRQAFEEAIALGHGIECDVQETADGHAVVFHDYDLDRLTNGTGAVIDQHASALDKLQLNKNGGKILRLREMLALVAGRVPILIEIKSNNARVGPLCLAVRHALEGYGGKAAVMSFNPLVCVWFRRNAEHIVRGLVVTEQDDKKFRDRLARHRNLWIAKPDFLAYDIRDLPSKFARNARERGMPVVTWTVRTPKQQAIAAAHANESIYEVVDE